MKIEWWPAVMFSLALVMATGGIFLEAPPAVYASMALAFAGGYITGRYSND